MTLLKSFSVTQPITSWSLGQDLWQLYAQIKTAIRYLSFLENFKAKEVKIEFSGTSQMEIINPFGDGTIPTRWFAIDVKGGALTPYKGTVWNENKLSLINAAGGTVTAIICFMR